MKGWALLGVAFLALAGVIGLIAQLPDSGGGGGGAVPNALTTPAPGAIQHEVADKVALGGAVPAPAPAGGAGGGGAAGFSSGSAVSGAATSAPRGANQTLPAIGAPVSLIGPKIVKTADISLVVPRGHFGSAFHDASLVASHYGGFVESSSTRGTRSHTGRLVIRVPAVSFELALGDLRDLGRVEGQSIRGQDVTSEFVDLQARLRNWEAQESVLLRLMKQATTVEQTLRVQRELQDVQLQIEELRGQLRVLNNQTSMGTIEVSMREAGTPLHPGRKAEGGGLTLGEAWDDAVDGFVGVLASVVIGLGYLIPITALAALGWIGYRRLRPRVAA